jgi:hypothetical protein
LEISMGLKDIEYMGGQNIAQINKDEEESQVSL